MYFVAVVLPGALNEEIKVFKTTMLVRWGCKVGLKSPAHITLVPPFWMAPQLESELQTAINTICSGLQPFAIETKGFAAFKPRTIFIEPVLNDGLRQLKQNADTFFKSHNHFGAKVDSRPFHPHITIATRDLHKKAFAEAWPLFEHQPYERMFNVDGVSLLRHNTKAWDVVYTATFNNAV